MSDLIYAVIGFLLAVGLLTLVHEFGHFWVARLLGIKVLRFSIGFGRPILSWHDKLGTEYVLALIPLGGYVKMLEAGAEMIAENERHMVFEHKPVWARMLVILAGPLFNFLFAILAYWLVFMLGVASMIPILGVVPSGSAAEAAGLKQGYEIVRVNDRPTPGWEGVSAQLMAGLGEQDFAQLEIYDSQTQKNAKHVLNLSNWFLDNPQEASIRSLGLLPWDPLPPVIGFILPDYPAEAAGLAAGDKIIAIDGQAIETRTQMTEYLYQSAEVPIQMTVARGGDLLNFRITPIKKASEGGQMIGFIGIQYQSLPWPKDVIRLIKLGPWHAFEHAILRTAEYTTLTVQFVQKMVTGKLSMQYVAGPISIARFAGESVESGLEYFLGFLALVSISLGILNLLPIPILDGGHFVYCLIELVQGKPVSAWMIEIGQYFGIVFIGGLMLMALYNDLLRF